MIARVAVIAALVLAVGAAGYLLFVRDTGEEPARYKVMIDNSFGLTLDADVKAAGVVVGKVADLDVDPATYRAVVTTEITEPDFDDFRTDVFCSVEPQSLIGEYFLNCDPGTAEERLAKGATIPVEQTATTVPPDLVNNIMRRPFRERFGIIIDELGRGFATRGPELQQVIRRAIPALRQTDRVLRILADNRRTLESLTRNADQVMVRLAGNRDDVARFVSEARDTAAASAERRVDLATDIRLLPPFLRRLRPVLRDLGTVADRQTPALRNLRLAAPDLELLLRRVAPFANASVPAVRSLGEASDTGREAMRTAGATIADLRELAGIGKDPIRNLRFILEHIDNREHAVEKNRLSPGGEGFTGLEAFLQYPFVQSQAINIYDRRGYLLKLNALASPCSAYRDESVRDEPEVREQCSAALGPGPAPGIDDGTGSRGATARAAGADRGDAPARRRKRGDATTGGGRTADDGDRGRKAAGGGLVDAAADRIGRATGAAPPALPRTPAPAPGAGPRAEQEQLLDFLLGG